MFQAGNIRDSMRPAQTAAAADVGRRSQSPWRNGRSHDGRFFAMLGLGGPSLGLGAVKGRLGMRNRSPGS
eukprot:4425125-Pyramimonas_sp.AAC.1